MTSGMEVVKKQSELSKQHASQLPKRPAAEMSLFPQPRAALLFRSLICPLHVTNNRRELDAIDVGVVENQLTIGLDSSLCNRYSLDD